uniref:Putative TRAP dicarboxylate transporter-DctP subunit n=1 Tax=Magnetococcus massalia (strain MO-1) TaxID=451514 RepID=A0A1S7LMD3_MAGMO|nr:Putative TRAP dicarboxylate transporter-DctP subunit [Candidatus Magnetococcus massalia]
MRYLSISLWVMALVALTTSTTLQAAPVEEKILYLSHLNANTMANATGAMATRFTQSLAHLSKGSLRVEVFPEGQLGHQAQIVGLVKKGTIQSAIVSVGALAKIYPRIGVLNYPFRFANLQDTYRVFDGPFGHALAKDIFQTTGLKVLGYGDTGGLFVLTNSKKPVHSPDDMDGMRVRTMNMQSHQLFIKSLKGVPISIAWKELPNALSNRTVDGQMNPATIVQMGKLDRVQSHLTVTNHLYTPYIWIFNTAFLTGLSQQERAALSRAVGVGVDASRRLAASSKALEQLAKSMQITRPSSFELELFQEQTQPPLAKFIRESLGEEGSALLKVFQQKQPGETGSEVDDEAEE